MNENHKKNSYQGVNIPQNINKKMQLCEYCDTWYIPKKRFVQRFCSNSCRVMAYTNQDYRFSQKNDNQVQQNVQNVQKVQNEQAILIEKHNNLAIMKEAIRTIVNESIKDAVNDAKKDILHRMRINQTSINRDLSAISQKQFYHMFISGLAPLFAEPVRKTILDMFKTNQQPRNIEEFTKQMEPFTKDLAPELKEQIFSTANTFFGGVKGANND
jgi:hypothetical protein